MFFKGIDLAKLFTALPCDPLQDDCPAPDLIWQARGDHLPARARRRIVAHLSHCGGCAEAWRLARILHDQAERPQARIRRFPRQWHHSFYLAAALLMAGLVVFFVELPKGNHLMPAIQRGEQPRVQLVSPLDGAVVSRQSGRLAWQAISSKPVISHYDLRVSTHDIFQVLVEERGLRQPEYTLPSEILASLPPQTSLTWRVTAHLQNGETSSRVFTSSLE